MAVRSVRSHCGDSSLANMLHDARIAFEDEAKAELADGQAVVVLL